MPRASKIQLPQKQQAILQSEFTSFLSNLDENTATDFNHDFFTQEEQIMLAKRVALYLMLHLEASASEIHKTLLLSRETIRYHKHKYQTSSPNFKHAIEKIANKKDTQQFLKTIEKILYPFTLAVKSKNNMQARAKFASGDWE